MTRFPPPPPFSFFAWWYAYAYTVTAKSVDYRNPLAPTLADVLAASKPVVPPNPLAGPTLADVLAKGPFPPLTAPST